MLEHPALDQVDDDPLHIHDVPHSAGCAGEVKDLLVGCLHQVDQALKESYNNN